MATTLYWLLVSVVSLMTTSTLLTGLFAWRMWVRPAAPARIDGSAPPVNRSTHLQ